MMQDALADIAAEVFSVNSEEIVKLLAGSLIDAHRPLVRE